MGGGVICAMPLYSEFRSLICVYQRENHPVYFRLILLSHAIQCRRSQDLRCTHGSSHTDPHTMFLRGSGHRRGSLRAVSSLSKVRAFLVFSLFLPLHPPSPPPLFLSLSHYLTRKSTSHKNEISTRLDF